MHISILRILATCNALQYSLLWCNITIGKGYLHIIILLFCYSISLHSNPVQSSPYSFPVIRDTPIPTGIQQQNKPTTTLECNYYCCNCIVFWQLQCILDLIWYFCNNGMLMKLCCIYIEFCP